MKRIGLGLAVLMLVLAGQARADTVTLPTMNNYAGQGSDSADTDWTCEIGQYESWAAFDLSGIPDTATILGMTFTAMGANYYGSPAERTLWYDADDSWDPFPADRTRALSELVGTAMDAYADYPAALPIVFNLNLSGHDWSADLADNRVSLMMTGPQDLSHECGWIYVAGTGNGPTLAVEYTTDGVIPEPVTMAGLLIGITGLGGYIRRRMA